MAQPITSQDEANLAGKSAASEDTCCPLCLEKLDGTDRRFFPCPCDYQLCLFCLDSVCKRLENKCPACRKEYDEKNYRYVEIKDLPESSNKRNKQSQTTTAAKTTQSHSLKLNEVLPKETSHYRNVRVVQRNLVYVLGLPQSISKAEELKKLEYFGRYGEIINVVIAKHSHSTLPCNTAYIAYTKRLYAADAIRDVDGATFERKLLRASFGTTKYCAFFLRGTKCMKPDCLYLHQFGSEEDSFTREQMAALRTRSSSLRGPLFDEDEALCVTPISLYRFQVQQKNKTKTRFFGLSIENSVLENFRCFKNQSEDTQKKELRKSIKSQTSNSSTLQTSPSIQQTSTKICDMQITKKKNTKNEPQVLSKSKLNAWKSVNSLQLGQTKCQDKQKNENHSEHDNSELSTVITDNDKPVSHKQANNISEELKKPISKSSSIEELKSIEQKTKVKKESHVSIVDNLIQTKKFQNKEKSSEIHSEKNSAESSENNNENLTNATFDSATLKTCSYHRPIKQLTTTYSSLIEIFADSPSNTAEKISSAQNTYVMANVVSPIIQENANKGTSSSLDVTSSYQPTQPENLIAWPSPYENYNFFNSCEPTEPTFNFYEETPPESPYSQKQQPHNAESQYQLRNDAPTTLYSYQNPNIEFPLNNNTVTSSPSIHPKLNTTSFSFTCSPLSDHHSLGAVNSFPRDVGPLKTIIQKNPTVCYQSYPSPKAATEDFSLVKKSLHKLPSTETKSSTLTKSVPDAFSVGIKSNINFRSTLQQRLTLAHFLPIYYSQILEILGRQAQILENKLQQQLDEKIKQYHLAGDTNTAKKIHQRRESIIMPILKYSLSESSRGLITQIMHGMRTNTSHQEQHELVIVPDKFLNKFMIDNSEQNFHQNTNSVDPPEFTENQSDNNSIPSAQQYSYNLKQQSPCDQSSMFSFDNMYQGHQDPEQQPASFFTPDNQTTDDGLQLLKSVLPNACINVSPFSQNCNNQKDLVHVNCRK